MVYALMALMAVREMYRHIAKLAGWTPRYRPVRNHLFNGIFAFSAFCVALAGLLKFPWLATTGWFICGGALAGGMTVPCGWEFVNNSSVLWHLRQLLFLALSIGAIAYALGAL